MSATRRCKLQAELLGANRVNKIVQRLRFQDVLLSVSMPANSKACYAVCAESRDESQRHDHQHFGGNSCLLMFYTGCDSQDSCLLEVASCCVEAFKHHGIA